MTTAFKQLQNNARSVVSGTGLNNTTDPVTFNITTGHGSRFPTPGNGFYATVWDAVTYSDPGDDPNMEIVKCTGRSTDALTVARAQQGTAAVAHASGSAVRLLLTATDLTDMQTAINTLEAAGYGTATAAKVVGSDTSTSITGSGEATTNIAIGSGKTFAVAFLHNRTDTSPGGGGVVFATTTLNDAKSTIGGTNVSGLTTYLSYASSGYEFGPSFQYIVLKSAQISGSNLVLTWKNTDASARVLQAYWSVFAL